MTFPKAKENIAVMQRNAWSKQQLPLMKGSRNASGGSQTGG